MYADDAEYCLDLTFAHGGKVDAHEVVDLAFLLDAAHGDEFSHWTFLDRPKLLKQPPSHPDQPVLVPPGMYIRPTNFHVLCLQQEICLAKFWALIAKLNPTSSLRFVCVGCGCG